MCSRELAREIVRLAAGEGGPGPVASAICAAATQPMTRIAQIASVGAAYPPPRAAQTCLSGHLPRDDKVRIGGRKSESAILTLRDSDYKVRTRDSDFARF